MDRECFNRDGPKAITIIFVVLELFKIYKMGSTPVQFDPKMLYCFITLKMYILYVHILKILYIYFLLSNFGMKLPEDFI